MRDERDKDTRAEPPRTQEPDQAPAPFRPRLGRHILLYVILVGAVLVGVSLYRRLEQPGDRHVAVDELNELIRTGALSELRIRGTRVRGVVKAPGSPPAGVRLSLPSEYISSHLDEWAAHMPKGAVRVEESSSLVASLLVPFVPVFVMMAVLVYFLNRQMRVASARDSWMPFVGSSTQLARKERPRVTFDDVAGVDEAKEEVQELIEFLRNPDKFRRVGGRIPRGVLLVGSPGTGKTLLAKAIAGEADVPFFSLCGSDFVELFVGVGAARVRDLFRKARQNQPCIIFLDEIDAVGRKRGTGLGGGHDEREQTLNAILSEMDGFSRDEGIIVIAATNRPDVLDPALLRPGRFDREIVVDMPDVRGREEILKVHCRKVRLAPNVDLSQLARGTPGFTGADLEALVNEAAIRAAMKGQQEVRTEDLEEARDKVRFGRQKKKSRIMSDEDRRMTAYHEAGHALVARLSKHVEPLHKVTIIPRGVSLGMTMVLPEKDKYGLRRKECLATITMNMAGRVAEEMFCDDISSGAESDIRAATDLARRMVTAWGMSDTLGPVSYSDEEQHIFLGNEITRTKRHSEQMAQRIDREVRAILMNCYNEARRMCTEHAAELQRIACALLELETLSGDDVDALIKGATVEELSAKRRAARAEAPSAPAQQPAAHGDPAEGGYPAPAGSPA